MYPLFNFKMISIDGKIVEEKVEELYFEVPELGLTGILANHLDYTTTLFIGILYTVKDGVRKYYAISGGILSFVNNTATVLADTFESSDELDRERIEAAKARAEKIINEAPDSSGSDYQDALFILKKATNRLRLLK